MKKRLLCMIMALALLAGIPAGAAAAVSATISISDAEVKAGESVELVLSVSTNPGISGAGITIAYDETALTLTDIQVLVSGSFSKNLDNHNFSWLKGKNVTDDFEFVKLFFDVKYSAGGDYTVGAKLTGGHASNLTNQDMNSVPVSFVAGTVSVEPAPAPPAPPAPPAGGGETADPDEGEGEGDEDNKDDEAEDIPCDGGESCPAYKFTDVNTAAWYHDAVDYVIENGIMNGTGSMSFEPNATTTRAMIVTTLYRLEGEPDVSAKNAFSDVVSGSWYADAVNWANKNNIVNGYGESLFGPNDKVTRQQIAAILYRYAQYRGVDTSVYADISAYDDYGNISSWASDAMQWANGCGLMLGRTETTLVPNGSATRAEVATFLYRWCEEINK